MDRVALTEDLSLSRLIMGMLKLSELEMSDGEAAGFFEELLDLGITTFDHGDYYGNFECERRFGRILKLCPSLRDRMEIVTKCGNLAVRDESGRAVSRYYDTSKEHILAACDASLSRLGVERLDMLILHRIDHLAPLEEIAEAFDRLKRSGKARCFGVSNYLPAQLDALRSFYPEIHANQLPFSVYNLEHFENGNTYYALRHKIGLMAFSPVAKGLIFTGQDEKARRLRAALEAVREETGAASLDEICYAFLAAHPAKLMPIIGSTKRSRIDAAVRGMALPLNRKQWYRIYEASTGRVMP